MSIEHASMLELCVFTASSCGPQAQAWLYACVCVCISLHEITFSIRSERADKNVGVKGAWKVLKLSLFLQNSVG